MCVWSAVLHVAKLMVFGIGAAASSRGNLQVRQRGGGRAEGSEKDCRAVK